MTQPVKLMTLIRAGDVAAWKANTSTRLASGLPGCRRIVLNLVRPVEVRATDGGEPYDAVLEGWFDSRANAEAARAVFGAGADNAAHLLIKEILIHDGNARPLPAKVIVAFRRLPEISRAAAQSHWRGRHVEVGLIENNATDFLRLYFQNHVLEDNLAACPEEDYDGLPEFWLDEDALANVGADSPVMKAIAEDEENFLYRPSLVSMLVEEHQLYVRAE